MLDRAREERVKGEKRGSVRISVSTFWEERVRERECFWIERVDALAFFYFFFLIYKLLILFLKSKLTS